MFLGKFLITFTNDSSGNDHIDILSIIHSLKLKEKTFLQVPCSNARRIKALDFFQDSPYLFEVGFNILREGKVIYDCLKVPANVSITFNTAHKLFANGILPVVQA